MKIEILIAGFGGQGVLSMGLFLAYGGIAEGKKVTYVPSYGAEMRGGTANCLVILSDKEISSPLVSDPSVVVVMNQPSLNKFEPVVRPGGLLLINASLAHRAAQREDITSFSIPAQEIANEVGLPRGANMVMLGALVEATKAVNAAASQEYLVKTFRGKYLHMMPLNIAAMEAGAQFIRNAR